MRKYLLPLLLIIILFSCKKEIIDNNQSASLHFSNDTIILDTAFHSIGTPYQTLTVYNRNSFTVLTNISLNLLSGGSFRMTVDGEPGKNHSAIEIPANDSIFIFLSGTLDENPNSEFLLTREIEFVTGTKHQTVKLVAPGRNANFHLPHDNIFTNGTDDINYRYFSIKGNKNWTNDLPHVIYGYVIIEPNAILTIEDGAEIYFHNNSGIFVGNPILINTDGTPPLNNGTLIIDGTLENKVTMRGDRLGSQYENIPGQWNGIHFVPGSINNSINYAVISNGTTAIRADSVSNNMPTVSINNTIIKNMSAIGILGQGANITATNTVISKCGQYSVACNIGGSYNFIHCTFANYWDFGGNSHRNTPSILLNNYYEGVDGNIYVRDLNAANFSNCIIDGNLSTEVSFQEQEIGEFSYNFDHCLIKLDPTINTDNMYYNDVIINKSPKFIDHTDGDFHLLEGSPAIDEGIYVIDSDIEGNSRNYSIPDIGAYEF